MPGPLSFSTTPIESWQPTGTVQLIIGSPPAPTQRSPFVRSKWRSNPREGQWTSLIGVGGAGGVDGGAGGLGGDGGGVGGEGGGLGGDAGGGLGPGAPLNINPIGMSPQPVPVQANLLRFGITLSMAASSTPIHCEMAFQRAS
eukprot:5767666-Prymnesium_polylepis.2